MKIVYIAEWSAYKNSGVLSKMLGQVKAWNVAGHKATLVLISSSGNSNYILENTKVLTSPYIKFLPSCIRKYANKILCARKLNHLVNKISPDIIYYRQSIWYPGLVGCLIQAPCIMELNSYDIGEKKLISLPARLFYLFGRRYIIDSIDGFVCVSSEIAKHYRRYKKPFITIANGILFPTVKRPDVQVPDNSRPKLIFVGTPGQSWHGVDKLHLMAKLLPEFDFHIVGEDIKHSLSNIYTYGNMERNELMKLYKSMNFGLGTLALHRKNMEEASPLKTREYALFGLPMIVGYKDTDLDGEDFVLDIGNTENNVQTSIDKIRRFVLAWQGNYVDRNLLESKLSTKIKEDKRLKFFSTILKS